MTALAALAAVVVIFAAACAGGWIACQAGDVVRRYNRRRCEVRFARQLGDSLLTDEAQR